MVSGLMARHLATHAQSMPTQAFTGIVNMTREPDRNFDPPEDEPECKCRALNDDRFDHETWCDQFIDRDCEYWEKLE